MSYFTANSHSAIIYGAKSSGKTTFAFDLLDGPFNGAFSKIYILSPTAYTDFINQQRLWMSTDIDVIPITAITELRVNNKRSLVIFDNSFPLEETQVTLQYLNKYSKLSVWFLTDVLLKDFDCNKLHWITIFDDHDFEKYPVAPFIPNIKRVSFNMYPKFTKRIFFIKDDIDYVILPSESTAWRSDNTRIVVNPKE
jgi:archaellum biogenesis ATPase FlaH